MRKVLGLIACGALAACSGGDSGGSGIAVVNAPAIATLNVTLSPSSMSLSALEANSVTSFTVKADYTGSTSDTIVPKFDYDSTVLALDGTIAQSGNSFTATFKSLTGLSAKTYATTIGFKLCRDSACATVYPGSTQSFIDTLAVALDNWTTRQRNAGHNGYVHSTFDPTSFVKAWDYTPATATEFEPAAAPQGTVFLTERVSDGSTIAVALDGTSGAERWHYSLGSVFDASGPALSGDQVAISSMVTSSGNNAMVTLNATTGLFNRNYLSAAQWSTFAQPTPFQDAVYIASGYYGNVVYAYDLKNAADLWQANGSAGHTWDGEAPAADSRYVYYYSGNLDVFDRTTGALVKSIADPFWQWNGYSYGGTPMLGSDDHVIAYSGNGMGIYSVSFPLVDYDIQGGAYRWRTASSYSVIPADAKAVVYAASNQSSEFDAIDEQSGKVIWAWPQPSGEQFVGNIVVTDTLAFVSTTAAVYAIDLTGTHQTKWSAKSPGWLAITPDAKLVISPIGTTTPAKVTAYTLR
jgi:hypothetical protein